MKEWQRVFGTCKSGPKFQSELLKESNLRLPVRLKLSNLIAVLVWQTLLIWIQL